MLRRHLKTFVPKEREGGAEADYVYDSDSFVKSLDDTYSVVHIAVVFAYLEKHTGSKLTDNRLRSIKMRTASQIHGERWVYHYMGWLQMYWSLVYNIRGGQDVIAARGAWPRRRRLGD